MRDRRRVEGRATGARWVPDGRVRDLQPTPRGARPFAPSGESSPRLPRVGLRQRHVGKRDGPFLSGRSFEHVAVLRGRAATPSVRAVVGIFVVRNRGPVRLRPLASPCRERPAPRWHRGPLGPLHPGRSPTSSSEGTRPLGRRRAWGSRPRRPPSQGGTSVLPSPLAAGRSPTSRPRAPRFGPLEPAFGPSGHPPPWKPEIAIAPRERLRCAAAPRFAEPPSRGHHVGATCLDPPCLDSTRRGPPRARWATRALHDAT